MFEIIHRPLLYYFHSSKWIKLDIQCRCLFVHVTTTIASAFTLDTATNCDCHCASRRVDVDTHSLGQAPQNPSPSSLNRSIITCLNKHLDL